MISDLAAAIERIERWDNAMPQDARAVVDAYKALAAAIRLHRDFRGDDRCYEDDTELYKTLPEGYEPPAKDTEIDLNRCALFKFCRQNPATTYVSPQRRIEELEDACKAAYRYITGDFRDGGRGLRREDLIRKLLVVLGRELQC